MKNRYKQAVDNKKSKPLLTQMQYRLREGLFLVMVACAIFLFISLLTYHAQDPSWSSTGIGNQIDNAGGQVGAWLADIFLSLFGVVAYFFPFFILLNSWMSLQEYRHHFVKKPREWMYKAIGWILLLASACVIANFYLPLKIAMPADMGGIIGDVLSKSFSYLLSKAGSSIFFMTTLLCGVTILTGLSWLNMIEKLGEYVYCSSQRVLIWIKKKTANIVTSATSKLSPTNQFESLAEQKAMTSQKSFAVTPKTPAIITPVISAPQEITMPLPVEKKIEALPVAKVEPEKTSVKKMTTKTILAPGALPAVNLLNPVTKLSEKPFSNISFEDLSKLVEVRLADFGVEAQVVAVHPGPVITRFELELAPGIKVSKITGLAKDIARSLSVVSVRVVDIIPGKSVIGLEIPNEHREVVSLKEMVESQRYGQSRSPLSLVLGKDIAGCPIVVDLAKMPHLLVAGTTGSGKSVSLNAMLLSMLYKSSPEQMRLILIDPKMLELSIYDGIPHLLTPVITDMKDAANALRWCVAEMDKRYRLMAALGVRNLASYNQKIIESTKGGEPVYMPGALVTDETSAKTQLTPLPLIVVIADELADMMMVVGKKVEELIARIAQKARAAGIHLILATQRPSVDVITGLIKANIPTRIAFQVSSRIDSRTILDQQGAEQLLGHGDMLYLPPGAGVPIRVHGAYVADEEVHRVVAAWRTYAQPQYINEITAEAGDNGVFDGGNGEGRDPLYAEAVRIVIESKRASISLVQRRLRIGYNRAARMMEEMELAGVVSSMDQSGSREVLAPLED